MKVVAATLALLLSDPACFRSEAAAQECQTCSSADICIQTRISRRFRRPKGTPNSNPRLAGKFGPKSIGGIVQQRHGSTASAPCSRKLAWSLSG